MSINPRAYRHKIIVEQLDPNAHAARSGLAVGDVITQIGKTPVGSLSDLTRAFRSKQREVVLRIQRNQSSAFIVLR